MNAPAAGIRKAAILVAALSRPAADRLLDRMDPTQAQQLRLMTAELERIDPQEQRQVIDEFFRLKPMVPEKHPPGIELDGSLARRFLGEPTRFSSEAALASGVCEGRPFRFLHDAEGEKLASLLAGERPQTIALVLSHLPPKQAGNVLVRLPPALQADVIRRLVDLEETEPEILREVERALEARFSEQLLTGRRRVAGLSAVAGILEASESTVGMQILDNLAAHDRSLAERFSPRPIEFVELAQLDDATLATVFRAAETPLVILALVGERAEMIDRVLQALPQPEARFIRDRLEHPGPTRLRDVEEARRRIAALARRLAIEGRIELPPKVHSADRLVPRRKKARQP